MDFIGTDILSKGKAHIAFVWEFSSETYLAAWDGNQVLCHNMHDEQMRFDNGH